MNEQTHIGQVDRVQTLSRRRLLKKAGLMGLGALGVGKMLGEVSPAAGAAGLQRAASQPALRSSQRHPKPTTELLQVLQNHPGGKEALAAAKKGSSRLSIGRLPSNLTRLPNFSVVLYPGHLKEGTSTVTLYDVNVLYDMNVELKKISQTQSKAVLKIAFPQHGWYLVNIEGALKPNWSISAKIRELRGPNYPGPIIQTWAYPKNTATQPMTHSFPAVYEHKGSLFGLEFSIETGGLFFQEVSVEAL